MRQGEWKKEKGELVRIKNASVNGRNVGSWVSDDCGERKKGV